MRTIFKKLILAMMLAISLPSFAHDFEVDGIYYNILSESDKTVEVTYEGDEYDSYTNEYSGSVAIPSTVTYSGTIYSVTEIDDFAFSDCVLTEIAIPNSVTSIGNGAFLNCFSLTSVTIPNSVTSIGNEAFRNCYDLASVTISDSVTEIGELAFEYCGLTEVTIPNSVTSIGNNAFSDCYSLNKVNFNAENCISMGSSNYPVFNNCPNVKTLNLGNSVKIIPNSAFCGCSGLTEVTIPNSITEIGEFAFRYCNIIKVNFNAENCTSMGSALYPTFDSGLKTLNIGSSVTTIPRNAFSRCTGLTSVTIPNSVTSIRDGAFLDCRGLTEVNITDLVSWCKIDFEDYDSNPLQYAKHLKLNGTEISDLIIPDGITAIKSYAFYYCSGLTSIQITNSVTSINRGAFNNCTGLTSVTIPNSVTSIGNEAFYKCSGLTSVSIGNSVTKIGDEAFYDCSSLKYVDYNAKNLLNVGSKTNLSYAKFIIVGENVETIPAGIINSSAATTIISKNTIPPVCDSNAFSSVNKSKCTLYVPSASYVDYWSAEVWKEFSNIKPFIETTSITFDAENYKIETGESLQINANIAPNEVSIIDLIWTSSNPEVATVSSTGKVVGILPGEVTITARTIDGSNLEASCKVTVGIIIAESIALSQKEVELAPYESVVLTYTILPESTTNKSVTWSSSDESIATFKVNNDGSATVLMLKDDKAVITATTNDGSNLSASCVVGKTSGVDITTENELVVTVEDGKIVVKNVTDIVTIYNLNGIAVATETADGNEVRFDNLHPGVYIVVVNNKSVKVVL